MLFGFFIAFERFRVLFNSLDNIYRRYTINNIPHWLNIDDSPYLAVQSAKNAVKFFSVDSKTKKFEENESLRVTLSDSDTISCTVAQV